MANTFHIAENRTKTLLILWPHTHTYTRVRLYVRVSLSPSSNIDIVYDRGLTLYSVSFSSGCTAMQDE